MNKNRDCHTWHMDGSKNTTLMRTKWPWGNLPGASRWGRRTKALIPPRISYYLMGNLGISYYKRPYRSTGPRESMSWWLHSPTLHSTFRQSKFFESQVTLGNSASKASRWRGRTKALEYFTKHPILFHVELNCPILPKSLSNMHVDFF